MSRSIRYWFRNVEEMIAASAVALGILLLLQPFLWGNGIDIRGAGFLFAIVQGVCMVSLSVQSLQLISINIIFGATRKDSLRAMHIAMLTGLIQVELIQLVCYLLPVIDKDLQFVAICYTPILFLFGNGVAYMVSWFQFRSEKAYKVILTIFFLGFGAVMGLTGAMSGDLLNEIGGTNLRNALDGVVIIISSIIAVVLYVTGGFIHSREIRNMDVRV